MPCMPAKARHLLKNGKARPKRNKLGLFYIQLTYRQEPNNKPLLAGIDPGSKFELRFVLPKPHGHKPRGGWEVRRYPKQLDGRWWA